MKVDAVKAIMPVSTAVIPIVVEQVLFLWVIMAPSLAGIEFIARNVRCSGY